MPASIKVTHQALAVSFDADRDRLTACAFGTEPDRRFPGCQGEINDRLRFLLRSPGGTVIGFELRGLYEVDVDDEEPCLWTRPRFRVPALGLRSAVVAEVVLRARSVLAGRSTPDVLAVERAAAAQSSGDTEAAEVALRDALGAGHLRAHQHLAGCLLIQGRYAEAYDHARIFTELAPRDSWAWTWLGRACVEMGATQEATAALRRAVRLQGEGAASTPAASLLATLRKRGVKVTRR